MTQKNNVETNKQQLVEKFNHAVEKALKANFNKENWCNLKNVLKEVDSDPLYKAFPEIKSPHEQLEEFEKQPHTFREYLLEQQKIINVDFKTIGVNTENFNNYYNQIINAADKGYNCANLIELKCPLDSIKDIVGVNKPHSQKDNNGNYVSHDRSNFDQNYKDLECFYNPETNQVGYSMMVPDEASGDMKSINTVTYSVDELQPSGAGSTTEISHSEL